MPKFRIKNTTPATLTGYYGHSLYRGGSPWFTLLPGAESDVLTPPARPAGFGRVEDCVLLYAGDHSARRLVAQYPFTGGGLVASFDASGSLVVTAGVDEIARVLGRE